MKKTLIRIAVIMLTLLTGLTCLASCDEGISKNDAIATTEGMFDAMAVGDFETAASLFHPDTYTNAQNLEDYCASLKEKYGFDISGGLTVEKYTGFSSAYYDSNVGGSRYELTMKIVTSDGKAYSFTTEVVKNDAGYGLTNLQCNG